MQNPKQDDSPGERAAARDAVGERERRPGDAGLANEARPGFGTRANEEEVNPAPRRPRGRGLRGPVSQSGAPKATRYGYEEPRPEPREQASDSLAHDQERSTAASGHTGNG